MRKQEIIQSISCDFNIPVKQAHDVVDAVFNIIKDNLIQGDGMVTIRGFGTFSKKHRGAKIGRNITKGTAVNIPEKDVPHFKPCKTFKASV